MGISKGKINQAGYSLIGKGGKLTKDEVNDALRYFRYIHQHPMLLFRHTIDRKLKKNGVEALVSQRLKRIPSIIKKLKIQKTMRLSRMQDIGGLRIVVNTVSEVYLIRDEIKKAEQHGNFKFIFANEKDYIKSPQDSGYRSIHLVYKYEKGIPSEKQCRVEVQIRTELHHSWATAVEVVGTYLNQPLKQSFGDARYLDIFKKISKLFVSLESISLESKDINYKFVTEVKDDIDNVKLLEKLENFNIIAKHLDDNAQGQYALLKMDLRQNTIEITQYSKAKFKQANKDYLEMELDNNNKLVEIVLISMQDIQKLKQSYPNYFMDTAEFIKNLNILFKSTQRVQKIEEMIDSAKNEQKIALNEMRNGIFGNILELFNGSKK